jgi:hypothetical protein
MSRSNPDGLVDLRGHDWSTFDGAPYGDRERTQLLRAIPALEDPEVADATYRLVNFGDAISSRSLREYPEATWLLMAFRAAVALDRLPEVSG